MNNYLKYADDKDRIPHIMKRAKQGWTLTAIAKEIEISVGALSRYCKDHKVDHGLNHRIKYDDVKILKLIKKKIPFKQAKKLKREGQRPSSPR